MSMNPPPGIHTHDKRFFILESLKDTRESYQVCINMKTRILLNIIWFIIGIQIMIKNYYFKSKVGLGWAGFMKQMG